MSANKDFNVTEEGNVTTGNFFSNPEEVKQFQDLTKEKSTEEKLEELIEFDEKGAPDKLTEEEKLAIFKRQWEQFEQGWKMLGRKGRRKMIKSSGKYSNKLKHRLKNI